MKAIAVIDRSINSLFIYDVPIHYSNEDIEAFISGVSQYTSDNDIKEKPLHKLSNSSWGEFDGIIEDQRN